MDVESTGIQVTPRADAFDSSPSNTIHNHASATKLRKPDPVDLRALEYVSDFDRHLACPICRYPFIDPVRLSCDHTYCRHCYKRALQNQQDLQRKTCPTCRRPIEDETIPIPRFIIHMIEDLAVRCIHYAAGCEAKLTRADVQSHVDLYCLFTLVPCPSADCSEGIVRSRSTGGCLHQRVTCDDCQSSMLELELEEHLAHQCTKSSSPCKGCEAEVLACDTERHLDVCPEVIVPCIAASIGCSFESKRRAIRHHLDKCPMAAMTPFIQSMNSRVDNQAAMIRALQTKNDILESSFATIQSLLTSVGGTDESSTAIVCTGSPASLLPHSRQEETQVPRFDSAEERMLSMQDSLMEHMERTFAAISEVEGRTSMTLINETLRIRDEMAHQNAMISSLRLQLQALLNARMRVQSSAATGVSAMPAAAAQPLMADNAASGLPAQPVRRLSDPSRQNIKL